MAAPTASIALAEILPDSLMRATASAEYTSDPVNGDGPALPTYSGLGMWEGTERRGETRPGVR